MSTSLAEQLQKLALPQSRNVVRGKKRASILFDLKEAAALTRETVFQIGQSGFEELLSKDKGFQQFRISLFDESSKDFERSVQSEQVNKHLNETIKRFFHRLTPYFLLSCAHKCLEWLIQRYYVHEYNKDELIMLILPYHESNIFVRVLQTVRIKNDRWTWLKSIQKPGVHLPKSALYNHAASDPSFLQFVSQNLLAAMAEFEGGAPPIFLNFYCATFIGALEYSEAIDETHVSQMLPTLVKGLKSEVSDFVASTYMIVSLLLTKTTLSDKLARKLAEKLSAAKVPSLNGEAIMGLVVLYQAQEQYTGMSEVTVKNLAERAWVPLVLSKLFQEGYCLDPLLMPLFTNAVRMAVEEVATDRCRIFVKELISNMTLEDHILKHIIRTLLDSYVFEESYSDETKGWMKSVLDMIEHTNPSLFDKEIALIMRKTKNDEETDEQKVLSLILSNSSLHDSYTLFEQLYSPEAAVRKIATKTLMQNYSSLKSREQDFIKSAILDRLNDESDLVVREVLRLSRNVLLDILNANELKPLLLQIVKRSNDRKLTEMALNLLCNIDDGQDFTTFMTILPFLLCCTDEDDSIGKVIIASPYMEKQRVLQKVGVAVKSSSGIAISNTIYELITSQPLFDLGALLDDFEAFSASTNVQKYLGLTLLKGHVSEQCDFKTSLRVLGIFKKYMEGAKFTTKSKVADAAVVQAIKAGNKLPLKKVLDHLQSVIVKTEEFSIAPNFLDFFNDTHDTKFVLQLLDLLLTGVFSLKPSVCALYSNCMKAFFDHFCANLKDKLLLLANVSVADGTHVPQLYKLKTIKVLQSVVHENNEVTDDVIEQLVPYVFVGLTEQSATVRSEVLKLLTSLFPKVHLQNKYFNVFHAVMKSKDEIEQSEEQITLLFGNTIKDPSCFLELLKDNYPLHVKTGILKILSLVERADVYGKVAEINCSNLGSTRWIRSQHGVQLDVGIAQISETFAQNLKLDGWMWRFVELALKNDRFKVGDTCLAASVMSKIDGIVYNAFEPSVQLAVLNLVIEMAVTSVDPDVQSSAARVFKHIDLDVSSILSYLVQMQEVQSQVKPQGRKKQRVSLIPTPDILDSLEWKKGVAVLEFLQEKKKIRNIKLLIPILFKILKRCLDFDEQTNVEYPKQLVLSAILFYMDRLEETEGLEVELVVQCIRASQNPQTHHHALLLLTHFAKLLPDQILHHITAIFTFMGSSVLRHDDAYSFQIITKIMDMIIPILVRDNRQENVLSVLRVFVDIILDVPEHRRLPLYKKLLEQIGPKEHLYLFLLAMFHSQVMHHTTEKRNTNEKLPVVPKRMDIASDICKQFAPDIVIDACVKLLEYLKEISDKANRNVTADVVFDLKTHTPKQFRHYKYTIMTFISGLLLSQDFIGEVVKLPHKESMELEDVYKKIIINVLIYIQESSKILQKHVDTKLHTYWKIMLFHAHDVLDGVNALLSPEMFLLVVRGLLTHNIRSVRKRALDLINSKLQQLPTFFENCDEDSVYQVIPPLITIIKSVDAEESEHDEEVVVQTALISLKYFVKVLAVGNPEKFTQVLQFLADIIKSPKIRSNVLASAVLTFAELCTVMRAYAIPHIDPIMSVLIKIFKSSKKDTQPSVLLLSGLTALLKIVETLSAFLSPYMEKLLCEISTLDSKWSTAAEDEKVASFQSKIANVKSKLSTGVPSRILIPNIETSYNTLVNGGKYKSAQCLMAILAETLSQMSVADVKSNIPELTELFLNALELRVNSTDDVGDVESSVIAAVIKFVLKLSDASFRPFLYKLHDWAVRIESKSERTITYYAALSEMAAALQGLFSSYAGNFISNAVSCLDACNKTKNETLYFADDDDKNVLLVENVLKALNCVFVHVRNKNFYKDRFELLMQPIVDQMDNNLGESFVQRSKDLVIPCIVNFAVATENDALWKLLNYQVLLKMKHADAPIRLLALECLRDLATKLGQDFLPLLPETIPFLAELLEDEDEDVEKLCQRTVQEMEKVLGESLQKYF